MSVPLFVAMSFAKLAGKILCFCGLSLLCKAYAGIKIVRLKTLGEKGLKKPPGLPEGFFSISWQIKLCRVFYSCWLP